MNRLHLKNNVFLVFLLVFTILLSACSASSYDVANTSDSMAIDQGVGFEEAEMISNESPSIESGQASGSENIARKLIKTGNVDIRTEDVDASYANISKLVKDVDGYETSLNRNESESYISINTQFNIPSEQFDAFFEKLQEAEDVQFVDVSTDDITSSYYDTELRLKSQRAALDKYYELLENADSMEDIITIQSQIDMITMDIESLEGQLRFWDSQVNYSSVHISIMEYADKLNTNREVKFSMMSWSDFTYFIGSGWTRLLTALVAIVQWLTILLIVALPILIPIAILIFLLIRFSKKRKQRLQNKNVEILSKNENNDKMNVNQNHNDER